MGATFSSTEIIIPAGVSKIVMYGSIEGDVPTGKTGRATCSFQSTVLFEPVRRFTLT
jgi:hypothetical protein